MAFKVLHIITNLKTGGAEKLLVDSLPQYKKKGIIVDLLLLNGEDTSFKQRLISDGIQVFSLGDNSVYNFSHIFKLIPYLRNYDIIHAHLFPTLYWVAISKLLSLSKSKLIFTEHSTFNNRLNKKFWSILDNAIYRKYDKIVSITTEVDQTIKDHLSLSKDKFEIINNGIDLSRFEKENTKLKSKIIIQISSFNIQKDQVTLIKAMKFLPHDVKLIFVGDGIKKGECENLVEQLNLQDRIKFLGIRNDIPELLASSDIVVQSSHHEGFGLAAVEGMAAGRPVIASDVPGLNTVVGSAGLLFPVGDEEKLAEKINLLLSDDELYTRIANKCFERSKMYDINTMVDKYIELYKGLIKK